ncbi:hypothetical protein BCE75_10247 [Isoptericola sp. CG 20/1183]|uniref:Uncharacterized protein n=1 Tax=Isoptericola halotolerans TaxID=300560 RepID=A0ABX5EK95_9MICO|nr:MULTISPECIES: hypothetical protein [Isoptericola]MCK0117634.1 hypothetical protein [Isoptericola sp. S6320L]PRZ09340.1 hypothetical protein BCE75_10247 [Isoptericola sp. CG 20/1183]PRZ10141.1 hypothetical protein BCL65_101279 [Isoptericola halotolerans]
MSYVQTLVPPEHASNHVLVVPEAWGPDRVRGLADAWFPDVRWLKEPRADAAPRPHGGARFRGMATGPAQQAGPGVLGVGDEHGAAGPFPVSETLSPQAGLTGRAAAYALGRVDGMFDARAGRPTTTEDRDGIARAFAAGLPEGEELRLVQWGVAVARKTSGVLLADGRQLLHPDPASAVDLALFAAHLVPPDELLGLLRSFVATAEQESSTTAPDGTARTRLVARTPYDGTITVEAERVERVPRALVGLDWREYGPHTYRMAWVPQDPYELGLEQPSGVHVIARARMRAMIARIALLLHSTVGGAMVDDGAFLATTAEVERRTAEDQRTASRAWI